MRMPRLAVPVAHREGEGEDQGWEVDEAIAMRGQGWGTGGQGAGISRA